MRSEARQSLPERYGHRCGYCGVRETDAGAALTADHFQTRAKGGSDAADNLVYCCHACNEFKGDYWQPESERRILHPLRDNMTTHFFTQEDGTLQALTETGRFHIQKLRLNRAELLALRCERQDRQNDAAEQQALLNKLAELKQRIKALESQIIFPNDKA